MRRFLLLCSFFMFSLIACSPEVEVRQCKDCPDRCLMNAEGGARCVQCLTDEQCQTPTSPTRKCSARFKCICGTDKDCSKGRHCGGDGKCWECTIDAHCKGTGKPNCIEFYCQACKPGESRFCDVANSNYCSKGKQVCRQDGSWDTCKLLEKKLCQPTEICKEAQCVCRPNYKRCDGKCVSLMNNPDHCGQCGNSCPKNTFCADGHCVKECPVDTPTVCGRSCANLNRNPYHCGQCGKLCVPGQLCVAGECRCPPHQKLCNNVCVDVETSAQHCGRCGHQCKKGYACASGACLLSCPKSTPKKCFGSCVNTDENPLHCGKCGNACAEGEICKEGRCHCPHGTVKCGGRCVDTNSHPRHCGKCEHACAKGHVCVKGRCLTQCPKSTPKVCFGGCFNLKTTKEHCGKCGHSCRKDQICEDGKCRCPKSFEDCNGTCVRLRENRLNCGKCGNACKAKDVCYEGRCVALCPPEAVDICYGACVNLQSDIRHCGKCRNACFKGQSCLSGKCLCLSGLKLCGEQCVDVSNSQDHCGDCNIQCREMETCVQGLCIHKGCPPERPTECDRYCSDLQTDPNNCGSCGHTCPFPYDTCSSGICMSKGCSLAHPMKCKNGCVDPKTDDKNCGKCGNVCHPPYTCIEGKCKVRQCFPPMSLKCGVNCYNPKTDDKNCGKCGNVCKKGTHCCDGKCSPPIPNTLDICDGKDNDCDGLIDEDCSWLISFGSTEDEKVTSMTFEPKSRFLYVIGTLTSSKVSFGTTQLSKPGKGEDLFISKLNSSGTILQTFLFGGEGDDHPRKIFVDQTGIYVIGSFSKTLPIGPFKLKTSHSKSFFIFKLNFKGAPQWATFIDGLLTSDDMGFTFKNKYIYLTGQFQGKAQFSSQIILNSGNTPTTFVAKMTTTGKFIWAKQAQGPSAGIDVDADNSGIYVTGNFSGSFSFGKKVKFSEAANSQNVFLLKLDDSGTILWGQKITCTDQLKIVDLTVFNNTPIIGGHFSGEATMGTISKKADGQELDVFAAKFKNDGTPLWLTHYGGVGPEFFSSMSVDQKGIYVTGTFQSTGTGRAPLPMVFVGILDHKGSFSWANQLLGMGKDYWLSAIHPLPDGSMFIAGQFSGSAKIKSLNVNSNGKLDALVAKMRR